MGKTSHRRRRSRHQAAIPSARRLYERLTHPLATVGWRFVTLAAFVLLVFLTGGSARPDLASLPILRPVAAMVLAIGCASLRRRDYLAFRGLYRFAFAVTALVALQLVPLPPGLIALLPGRGVVVAIDAAIGAGDHWRPIAMAPTLARNALWSLLVPLAVLVLASQLREVERQRLLLVLLGAGLLSALIGIGQIVDSSRGPLYLYSDTHFGLPVGLLANRNHQALLLAALLPMLAVWARHGARLPQSDSSALRLRRGIGALGVALVLVPLVLATGSRSGLLVTLLAVVTIPLVLRGPSGRRPSAPPVLGAAVARVTRLAPVLALITAGCLVAAAVWTGRAESVSRLAAADPTEDLRVRILPTLGAMARTYWLTGSGPGSFRPVYRMFEPDAVLAPTMMNAAHDDWIEVLLTTGLPGVALLLVAGLWWVARARRLLPAHGGGPAIRYGRLGLALFALVALASLTDYPARVPALSCLLVIAALWVAGLTGTVPLSDDGAQAGHPIRPQSALE